MSEARIIKRYANRKLYDTQHSRYVTLEQIAEMIREGDDVRIIDNKTKDDLTSVTLAQIIFEEEKKQKSFLPLQAMRNIIQSGGESITHLVTEAQRRVTNILPRKREGEEGEEGEELDSHLEAAGEGEPEGEAEGVEVGAGKAHARMSLREFREWIQTSQQTIDDWQKRVDERIRHVVEGISPVATLQKDVRGLASRIAQLEAKLARMVAEEEQATEGSKLSDEAG